MQKIPKHIKPGIKIQPDFTYENLGYIPNPPSDDDILYYWGLKLTKGIEEKPMFSSKKRLEMLDATRDEIIQYAKDNCFPIMPDDQEYIPRKYWPGLKELIGEDLRILGHPIWNLTQRIIRENWKPTSTTLIVQACSNSKPYIENISYSFTKKRHEEGYCDVVVNSIELVPLEFTYYYPFRHYDWSHLRETEFITDALIRKNIQSIISFVRDFGYKKIIVFGPPKPDTFYQVVYEELLKQYKGTDVEVYLLMDDETTQECLNTSAHGHWGLLKSRYYNYFPTRKRLDYLINYHGAYPLPSDEQIAKDQAKRAKRLEDKKRKKILDSKGFNFSSIVIDTKNNFS